MQTGLRHIIGIALLLLFSCYSTASVSNESQAPYTNTQLLSEMVVMSLDEQLLNQQPALVLTFSQPIDVTANYNNFITLTQGGIGVKGEWVHAMHPRQLYFNNIQPNLTYRVQIRPGLTAKADNKAITKPVDLSIKTRALEPAFDFASRGSILPLHLANGLPIRVVNVPELDIEFLRVPPENLSAVLKKLQLGRGFRVYELNDINTLAQSVYTTRYLTQTSPNANTVRVVPIATIPALQQPGLYFAVMRQPGSFGDKAYRLTYFIVSDIGLHVRRYKNEIEVFANSLATGKALNGLNLVLQGDEGGIFDEATNTEGQASFRQLPKGALLLTAQLGEQFAFLDLRDPKLDLAEFNLQGQADKAIDPFIYSERDLFRPNDTVDLSILLRDRDGFSLRDNELFLRIRRPDQKVFLEQTLNVDTMGLGYFNYALALPADAALGQWTAEVRLEPQAVEPLASYAFNVQAYSPDHLVFTLASASESNDLQRKMVLALQADTINGQSADGYQVQLTRVGALEPHPFPQWRDFFFGDPRDSAQWPDSETKTLTLNTKGGAFVDWANDSFKAQSPITMRVKAQVFEPGGHSLTRELQQLYWPAKALVGIKPLFSKGVAEENSPAQFEITRVDQQGNSLASNNLAVSLVRLERDYYWEYSAAAGWQQRPIVHSMPVEQRQIKLAEGATTRLSFPVTSGDYWLEVEDADTRLKAAYAFHAGWRWQGELASGVDQVKISLDKESYRAGDTAHVTVLPPSAGEAVLAVEGDRLLWSQRVQLPDGGATFDVPIARNWQRHDLYISALLLRPASVAKKITPNRALGIVHLPLDRSARQLNLTLEVPEQVLPEQLVTIKVKAQNLTSSNALVTLSAVDKATLKSTGFKTPDPFQHYFAPHRYTVELFDLYHKLIESFDGQALTQHFGGDNGAATSLPSTPQTITQLFSGAVPFNAQGEATIKLNMPSITSVLQLTAVAVAEDQFGSVTKDISIAAPVELQLQAPEFLATTDTTYLTVKLLNTSQAAQPIRLSLAVNDLIALATTSDHDYTLDKGQDKTLYLPIKAGPLLGQGVIEVRLEGKGFVMNRKLDVMVRSPYPRQTRSRLYNISTEDGAVTLDKSIIQNLQPAALRARFTLSSTPEMGFRASLEDLLASPYNSLEQTTSRAYPYLFLDEKLSAILGMLPLSWETRTREVDDAIVHLGGMQLANGSFAAWSGSVMSDAWLTAYVADFLLDAKEQGFAVPEYMLVSVLAYLEAQVTTNATPSLSNTIDNPEHLTFAIKAYSAYVLSRVERVSLGNLRAWYDQESKFAASSLPLVHMGLALYKRGDAKRSREAFARALSQVRDDKIDLGDYGSVIRDSALPLALLLRAQQEIPDLDTKIKELYRQIYTPNYLSTQEQVAIFRLGRQLAATQVQPNWGAQLLLQSRAVRVNQTGAYRLDLSARDFNAGVTVQADNGMSVYASLDIQGYGDKPPPERGDDFQIKRTFYDITGRLTSPEKLRLGDLVLVDLRITATDDTRDALVVELLPAGWALEQRPVTQIAEFMSLSLEGIDKPLSSLLENSPLFTEQFGLDRYWAALALQKKATHHVVYLARVVAAGQFKFPPPYIVDMYRAEHYGVGKAEADVVVPRLRVGD